MRLRADRQLPIGISGSLRQWLYQLVQDLALSGAWNEGGNTYRGAQTVRFYSLTDSATIETDASQSNSFRVTLGGNRTLANPSNMRDGGIYNWRIQQDGTGSRTLAYGSKFKWPGGTAPTLTTTAGAVDLIVAQYDSATDTLMAVCTQDFS